MKILKYVLLGFLSIVLLFILISAFLSDHFNVTRSIEIKASAADIFPEISDYNNWVHWSPWIERDKTIKNTFSGDPGMPGHKMSWTSEKSGNGSMRMIGAYPNDSILMTLRFEDFSMVSQIKFNFESKGDHVLLTWSNSGNLGFMYRFFGLMMDKMEGPDFEKGLSNLKVLCEKKMLQNEPKVETVSVDAQHVLTSKQKCTPAEIGNTLSKLYREIGIQMTMQKLTFAGAPFAIYHSYSNEIVDLEGGIPVDKPGKTVDKVIASELPPRKALRTDYHGAYSGLKQANEKMYLWFSAKGIKVNGPHWESYVTDPSNVKTPDEILTQLYYPVE